MIEIRVIQIDEDAEKISIDVGVPIGHRFTSVKAWTSADYKDYSKAIDLTSLLALTSENELFDITASDLSVTTVEGLWLIEFESDEAVPDNTMVGIAANLLPQYTCLVNNLLSLEIEDCEIVSTAKCNGCVASIYYMQSLISALEITLPQKLYTESANIVATLDELCDGECCCDGAYLTEDVRYSTINDLVING